MAKVQGSTSVAEAIATATEATQEVPLPPDVPSQLAPAVINGNGKHPTPAAFSEANEWEEAAGSGFEDVVASDLTLPFVKLLQSGSPETKRSEPEYVKGAREGLWLDSVSKRIFASITVIPCKLVTHYLEWKPRGAGGGGGGLVKNHGTDRSVLDTTTRNEKTGKDITPAGNEIAQTGTWFCLLVGGKEVFPTSSLEDEGTPVELFSQCVITFAATALKTSRSWASMANALRLKNMQGMLYQPALFAMSYTLSSVGTRNDQGSWYLPAVKQAGWSRDYPNSSSILKEAKAYTAMANELHRQLAGQVQEDRPAATGSERSSNNTRRPSYAEDNRQDDRGGIRREEDNEIPF